MKIIMLQKLNKLNDKLISYINFKNNFVTNSIIFTIIFSIILFSIPHSSYIEYFFADFQLNQYAHNLNLTKNFSEIIPNPGNINGLTGRIIEPSLNLLSNLNYNLFKKTDYFLYIGIFRLIEIFTILVFLFCFEKKIEPRDVLLILILYTILLVNFNRYDHMSYVNFPIIIFCLFHTISIKIKNNYLFFAFIFIGNLWAYIINPIYFLNVCFFPLIFFYSYFIYQKELKKFFLTLIANAPFAILFILISLGTSRIALSEFYGGSTPGRNFIMYTSENFILISSIFLFISISTLSKTKNFFCWFFIFYFFLCILTGWFYKINPDNWKIPPPQQIEYAIQYILIFILYKIIKTSKKNLIFSMSSIILFVLFFYHSSFFIKKNIQIYKTQINKSYDGKNDFNRKNYFWTTKDKNFFLKNVLSEKSVHLYLPNKGSDLQKHYIPQNEKNSQLMERSVYRFNRELNGSFWDPVLWKNKIITTQGYSQHLDINTTLANYFNPTNEIFYDSFYKREFQRNFTDNILLERQRVPKFTYKNPLIEFYDIDYILSDIPLNRSIDKIYKFKKFNLYLYKKIKKNHNQKINKINIINDYNNYKSNIKKFNNEVFISKKNSSKITNINKFCKIKRKHKNNEIIFNVINEEVNKCLAIFSIPFSYNNLFVRVNENGNQKNTPCKTFRAQFYFHACVIEKSERYKLKKNNLLFYSFGSLKDYLDFKAIDFNIY